jgi:hypothetical protein
MGSLALVADVCTVAPEHVTPTRETWAIPEIGAHAVGARWFTR